MSAPPQPGAPIDAAIVAHDRKELVFATLPLLLAVPQIRRVIVVDNASGDALASEGPRRFPEVEWLALEENLGCTAWNRAAALARAPFLLILDDDCAPDPGSLAAALARLEAEPALALAVFNVIDARTGRSEWGPLESLDGSEGWANAIGACLLVRRDAFLAVGGYKDFFLCFNDLDLVLSLWRAGFRVAYDARWRALHRRQAGGRRRLHLEVRNLTATALAHVALVPAVLVAGSFALRAARVASGWTDLLAVGRGLRDGVVRGLALRRECDGGSLPHRVRRAFYANFLVGRRFAAWMGDQADPPR